MPNFSASRRVCAPPQKNFSRDNAKMVWPLHFFCGGEQQIVLPPLPIGHYLPISSARVGNIFRKSETCTYAEYCACAISQQNCKAAYPTIFLRRQGRAILILPSYKRIKKSLKASLYRKNFSKSSACTYAERGTCANLQQGVWICARHIFYRLGKLMGEGGKASTVSTISLKWLPFHIFRSEAGAIFNPCLWSL